MKLLIAAIVASTASAFAPSMSHGVRSTALFNSRVDSSAAVEAALAATKEFGATSPEARVLWDIVEEMDSSDNSAASKPAVLDDEYETKVKSLSQMLQKTNVELEEMKALAAELKGVKLAKPAASAVAPDDAAMKSALAAARAASEEFGKDSTEAKLAWEDVEEIASSNNYAASQASLDEECLIEFIEGCEALEKFKAALDSR